MHTLTFVFDCSLPDGRLLEAAHDFTDRRSSVFPAVEAEHFEVHSADHDHADVTEGTGTGIGISWERCRYDWSTPGSVTAVVTDSNVYTPGSSWSITAVDAPHGSTVEMSWTRGFKRTIRGRLFGTAFRLVGQPIFAKYARQIIDNLETIEHGRTTVNRAAIARDTTI
jgi:hypothetical protein